MKVSKLRRALSGLLVLAMLGTLLPTAFAAEAGAESDALDLSQGYSEDPNAYEIYPVPHSVVYPEGKDSFAMTDTVTVVAETAVDQYTLDFVKEILERFDRTMVTAETANPNTTNILLGVYDNGDSTVADPTPTVRTDLFEDTDSTGEGKYDPYMLTAEADTNPNGVITIVGKDTDCVYYGVATLQMMFTSFARQKFLPVQIEDYSNVMFRGFIEGFYGGFDYEERESQMRSIRDVKGNIYVFASKTDYYHGEGWDVLYPDDELAQIKELAEVGKETKVEYAWSVHIGKGKVLDNITPGTSEFETVVEKLEAKFQQLYDAGVRNFHILNDDYNSGTYAAQVALLNTINSWLEEKGDCGPIVYCPAGYNVGWAGSGAELQALSELDDDIYIYWTGSDVNSPITQDNISWPYEKSGHYPVTWLNYPCSEHDKAGIYLGDISHYVSSADGLTGQMGIISNPVDYSEANKVAYFQLLSWGWNRDEYTAYMTELWEDCFKYLQPEVYESYLTIARNVSNCPDSGRVSEGFPESEYLADTLDSVLEKALSGANLNGDAEAEALLAEMDNILAAVQDFRENCDNDRLVQQLEPWLKSLESVAEACKSAISGVIAIQANDVNAAWTHLSNASLALDAWDDNTTPNYSDKKAKAGSLRLEPFASELVDYVSEALLPLLSPDGSLSGDATFYAVMGGVKQEADSNSDKMFDGSESTYASFSVNQQADDYYGIDLGSVKTVNSIDILQGKSDTYHDYFHNATLEVSTDGDNWITLVENVNSHHIQVTDLEVAARYVRLRLLETGYGSKPDYWTDIREFTVETEGEDDSPVYTSLDSEEGLTVAEDGGVYTLTADGDFTLANGDYVGIRLSEVMGVNNISLTGEMPQGFALQYSANSAVWTDAAGGEMETTAVRYVRLVNQSGAEYTGQLPQLHVTEADISVDLSYVSTNMGAYEGNWNNMVDGNRSTLVWTDAKQTQGQYIIFDLGRSQAVFDVTLWFPESGDYPKYLDISIGDSSDPEGEWTTIGSFADDPDMSPPYRYYACNGNGQTARYVKLEISQTATGWIKFNELEINQDLEQGADLGAFSGEPEGDFEKAMDGSITTLFAPGTVEGDNGYFQYLISENNTPTGITILQSPSAISNAEVEVQTADEQWVTLGTLNKGVCTFDTADLGALLALRLNWVAGTSPAIAEIIFLGGGSSEVSGEIPLRTPNIYEPAATELDAVSVANGTEKDMVGLPERAEVTLSGGQTLSVPITWSCDDYDADQAGTYTFTGTYELDGLGVSNPGLFTLTAEVTVKAASGEGQEENLALEHPVYVSGVEVNYQTGPALAVDGDASTRWSGNMMKHDVDNDSWIVVDLGDDVENITDISMSFHLKVWPTDYVVQVADSSFIPQDYSTVNVGTSIGDESAFTGDNAKDAACWTTIYSQSNLSLNDNPTLKVDEAGLEKIPEGTRYIRLYFTDMNSAAAGHSIGLKELTVTGTRTAAASNPDVASVAAVTATGVVGTEFDQLELPGTVVATLADGTSVRLNVLWDGSSYDAQSTEPQTITGGLQTEGTGVENPEEKTAQLTLTLTDAPVAEEILLNPSSLTVRVGTPFASLALPEQAVVVYSDGTSAARAVTWDESTYNPEQTGAQTVTGTVDGVADLKAEMPVTVTEPLQPDTFTVRFESNGGSTVADQTVESGTPAAEPVEPTRDGYTFAGWYADEALTTRWDFTTPVTTDLTLYAAWTQNGGSSVTRYTITV